MADDKLGSERRHGALILVTIIQDIREQLRIIIFKRKDLFRGEYQKYFYTPKSTDVLNVLTGPGG